MSLTKLAQCCRLVRLKVKGFKSLYDVIVEFPTRLTVLVGSNGSGKTALIESLLLLRDTLDYLKGRVVNPFLRWWSYRNVVWMHDETKPIEIGIGISCDMCKVEDVQMLLKNSLGVEVSSYETRYMQGVIDYNVVVSGAGGSFRIEKERVCIHGFGCIEMVNGRAKLQIDKNILSNIVETIYSDFLKRELDEICAGTCEADNTLKYELLKLVEQLHYKVEISLRRLANLLSFYVERAGKENYVVDTFDEAEALIWDFIEREAFRLARSTEVLNTLLKYVPCLKRNLQFQKLRSRDIIWRYYINRYIIRIVKSIFRNILHKTFARELSVFLAASLLVGTFVDNMVVLRPLDYRSLRSPQPLETVVHLHEDGSNLISLLFRLGRGRLPIDIAEVLASVLGVENVSGYFEPTPDGRITLKLVVDNLELTQPSIPEGAWKTMAIMAAILSGASLVAVDEFENSLHATAQELLLEELRRSVPTAIVATHSPVVVDAARSLEEIALVEIVSGRTRVKRLREPKELVEKLKELGITPSEALLYGIIKTD